MKHANFPGGGWDKPPQLCHSFMHSFFFIDPCYSLGCRDMTLTFKKEKKFKYVKNYQIVSKVTPKNLQIE